MPKTKDPTPNYILGALTIEDLKRGLVIVVIAVLLFLAYKYFTSNKNAPVVSPTTSLNDVKVGLNVELTGDLTAVGDSSKKGAQLFVDQINQAGGVQINGKKYPLYLDLRDNQGSVDVTKQVTQQMVDNGDIAIVGPNASKFAIAAGEVAEQNKILLISPWSTNPQTTINSDNTHKKYVRRAAFIDPAQGQALAQFGFNNLKQTQAAVIYDQTADVLKGQSDYFQQEFKTLGGQVVDVQTFKAGDGDFSTQLNSIMAKNPQVIFLPAYYQDAANIIKQAKNMGITATFLGSDAWGSQELLTACGSNCDGAYLSAHYSADSQDQDTQKFVQAYKKAYNQTPDDVAALTYDSFGMLVKALQSLQNLSREDLVNATHNLTQYKGVTGNISYQAGSGDPTKTIVILKVNNGNFTYETNIEPK